MSGRAFTSRGRLVELFSRNPLVRWTDRLEACAIWVAFAVAVVAAIVAIQLGVGMYSARVREFADQAQTARQIDVVAVNDSRPNGGRLPYGTVLAQWTHDSVSFREKVRVSHSFAAGEHFSIWIDSDGKPTAAPRTNSDAVADAAMVAAGAGALTLVLCALALAIVRTVLNRFRRRGWDVELELLTDDDGGRANHRR